MEFGNPFHDYHNLHQRDKFGVALHFPLLHESSTNEPDQRESWLEFDRAVLLRHLHLLGPFPMLNRSLARAAANDV